MSEDGLHRAPERSVYRDSPDDQLALLMDDYSQRLYAYLLTLLGDADTAADCVQDTFVRAYEHLRRHKPVSAQWLYRVARNRAMDEHRHRRRDERKRTNLKAAYPPSPSSSSNEVRRALGMLSPEDREVLYLFAVDGFSGEEIGEMLGVRADAIRMRISRARKRFRAAYGDEV